jgi:hypothetical protein
VRIRFAKTHQSGLRRQLVDVTDLNEAALELTLYGLYTPDIIWAPAWARSIKINADQDQMVQVKIHLIINAQHGCKEGLCPDSLDM